MVVKRGHTTVKIYLTPTKGCESFTVVHYLGEKRQRKTFADLEAAVTEAEVIATKLSAGELDVLTLTSADRSAYVRALEILKPTGAALESAAMQFAEASKLLGKASLLEAARYFASHHSNLTQKTVGEVVKELLTAKQADEASVVYVKSLNYHLGRFAESFPVGIATITPRQIEDFLRALGLSGRTRNNFRGSIGTLFHFAVTRGYVAKGAVDVESVAVAKKAPTAIDIFTVEEMRRVMKRATPAMVPFLAIGAFAGLRHAEILRLDWSQVRLADGFIEVKAMNAKTASRRLVPILDNLRSWLTPYAKPQGRVCGAAGYSKQLDRLAASVNYAWQKEVPPGSFEWKHNALRHSFISYRVAQTQNVPQVALEAGNSPRMIFTNYRELVRPSEATEWFSIFPAAEPKEIAFPKTEKAALAA